MNPSQNPSTDTTRSEEAMRRMPTQLDIIFTDDRGVGSDPQFLTRHRVLCEESQRRVGTRTGAAAVTQRVVIELAAERYFWMVEAARQSLSGLFTLEEFNTMLSTNCSGMWLRTAPDRMADAVTDELGDVDANLVTKLRALTPLQNEALFDLCETLWRGSSVEATLAAMGVQLAS